MKEDRLVDKIRYRILSHLASPQGFVGLAQEGSKATNSKSLPAPSRKRHLPPPEPQSSDEESISSQGDDHVAKAVCGTLNHLVTGESINPEPSHQGPQFHSVATPLGATLTSKIKSLIWGNDYVDFISLLSDKEAEYTITVSTATGHPSVSMIPPTRGKRIPDIATWLNAFQIYAAVYAERQPTSAPALFKYMSFVRGMASRGMDWYGYDSCFRKQKAGQAWGFDYIHWELYFQAQQSSQRPNTQQRPQSQPSHMSRPFRPPKGFCYDYSAQGKCTRKMCPFRHFCASCGEKHPTSRCTSRSTARPNLGPKSHNANKPS